MLGKRLLIRLPTVSQLKSLLFLRDRFSHRCSALSKESWLLQNQCVSRSLGGSRQPLMPYFQWSADAAQHSCVLAGSYDFAAANALLSSAQLSSLSIFPGATRRRAGPPHYSYLRSLPLLSRGAGRSDGIARCAVRF